MEVVAGEIKQRFKWGEVFVRLCMQVQAVSLKGSKFKLTKLLYISYKTFIIASSFLCAYFKQQLGAGCALHQSHQSICPLCITPPFQQQLLTVSLANRCFWSSDSQICNISFPFVSHFSKPSLQLNCCYCCLWCIKTYSFYFTNIDIKC